MGEERLKYMHLNGYSNVYFIYYSFHDMAN